MPCVERFPGKRRGSVLSAGPRKTRAVPSAADGLSRDEPHPEPYQQPTQAGACLGCTGAKKKDSQNCCYCLRNRLPGRSVAVVLSLLTGELCYHFAANQTPMWCAGTDLSQKGTAIALEVDIDTGEVAVMINQVYHGVVYQNRGMTGSREHLDPETRGAWAAGWSEFVSLRLQCERRFGGLVSGTLRYVYAQSVPIPRKMLPCVRLWC